MTEQMDKDKDTTRDMVTKMTQIYKSMERTYNEKIEMHEKEVEEQQRASPYQDVIQYLNPAQATQYEQYLHYYNNYHEKRLEEAKRANQRPGN